MQICTQMISTIMKRYSLTRHLNDDAKQCVYNKLVSSQNYNDTLNCSTHISFLCFISLLLTYIIVLMCIRSSIARSLLLSIYNRTLKRLRVIS